MKNSRLVKRPRAAFLQLAKARVHTRPLTISPLLL
jgi:hypothetical protein